VISDGQPEPPWEPPLDSFFTPEAGVPAAELGRAMAADALGRTTLTCGYNCLLAQTPDGLAVIDTGLGARFGGYGPRLGPLVGKLGERLAAADFAVSDLSAVVFTHLHQDHSRGAVWSGEPTFPAAAGLAHAAEVAFWSSEAAAAAAAEHRATALEAIGVFGERMRPFEYDQEILPGVRAVDAAGHTPGHTAFLLASAGERLLCLGDSFYDPLQLSHPGWGTPWDTDTVAAVRSRRRLLSRAADESLLVHAYHLPFPGLGQIARHGDAFAWHPVTPS
jgi:glyoxylase-like metal-dependent hydrolase (beta-lactamase superfamily II)